ncbi:hypothetical protein BN946_scf185006.g4 [Trametes cinnabarina]|uniref:Uncharacterized protein n=1 Tax=Pycnoporus cinnabarinus TaxID=5643 RepID=A0A060SQV3_PYCCI|nr:hypothetical protein BN946_scf185006.g4 [Trametes cinnabarina]
MVRTSRKRAKYTYAEPNPGVLGALSEIQQEHRKHAVHMATLRAQVRKMANARKDNMGPQWSQWVSRTVNRLADDGILDTSDPHGNVMFTPHAKKTITKLRRESSGPGAALSPGLERKIWKDVTRRFSGVGVKRARRTSSAANGLELDLVSSDDVGMPPRKKQARKSSSRLTKSELEAKYESALERLREAEAAQPMDAEELEALQENLAEHQREIAALREELAKLKDRPSIEDRRVTVGTSTSASLLTPPRTQPSLRSSSKDAATVPRSRSAALGVTRTLSGSLISNLSKQPTPEPSDAGSQSSDIDELFSDEDVAMSVFPEITKTASNPAQPYGLATPQSSPLWGDKDDFAAENTVDVSHDSYNARGAEELLSLKDQLKAQSAELEHVREERDLLRSALACREERLNVLESELRARDTELSARISKHALLEKTLATEAERRKEVEDALSASRSAVQLEQQRSSALEADVEALKRTRHDLQQEARSMIMRVESIANELKMAQSDASKWRSAYLDSSGNVETTKLKLTSISEECQALKVAVKRSDAALVETAAEHERTKATLAGVRSELAQSTLALESCLAYQEEMPARLADLERSLEDAVDRTRVLNDTNSALERASGDLQGTVDHLRGQLVHTEAELVIAREEVMQAQKVICDLRASEEDSSRAAIEFRTAVSELELTAEQLRSELHDSIAEVEVLRRGLETEQASRRAAESELLSTRATRDELLSDLADKTVRLSSLTKERDTLLQAQDAWHRDLEFSKAQHANAVVVHAAERSAWEDALATARQTIKNLEARVDGLNTRLSNLSQELTSVTVNRDELSRELQEVHQRSAELEEDLRLARSDVAEAEEEIEELRKAKAEDEASIQNLKSGLAKLRQLQMDALNEVDSKMISAHSAPTPGSRRRSSIAPRLSSGTRP